MALPALRADLQLSAASPALDGAPQWTLADPLRGRYFKLGASAIRLLQHWSLGDPQQVLQAANTAPGPELGENELQEMLQFLGSHDLLSASNPQQRASYEQKAALQQQSWGKKLLHQYLFFRIPLWRPDAFLNRTWPYLARHGQWMLRWGLPLILISGVFLVSRDWDRFLSTFPHLFSFAGAMAFAVALAFAKLCHEFGHAFMAKRAGCRVQSMGLAFMVLLPMFYTDVSDAWRVRDRRSRLLIGAGGVLAELLLAVLALLAWSLLPDGPLRSAAFMLASATWITTLLINLNPFMRFDGYFLISDLWGVDNLQQRAFALCRWRLREALFGYGEPAPEPWSPAMTRRLLIWGYGSWIWRAILFLGIALAVYHLFFKVLGIFLMLVELLWFIGLPVWRELGEWWQRRAQADSHKVLITGLSLVAILLVLVAPWCSSVQIPALLEAHRVHALHAPVAARLKAVHVQDGQHVAAGDLLLELDSPDLDARQAIIRREIEILQLQLRRQSIRSETVGEAGIIEQRLAEAVAEYHGFAAQRARLQLRAPEAGVVRDLLPNLTVNRWLYPAEPLAHILEPGVRLRGYLAEESLWRVQTGSAGRFIADDPTRPALSVRLEEVDATGIAYLELETLSSDHGGPIAIRRDAQGRAEPIQAQYGVHLSLQDEAITLNYSQRGVVWLDGERQSLLGAIWRRLAALGIRESGF